MPFQDQIAHLRTASGLTQVQLAKSLKRSVGTISNWECGNAIPNSDQLSQVADFFGVSTDFLLDRKEFSDPVIRSIQWALLGMDQKRRSDLKTILSIAFSIDFGEE